jgi:hypothetical protein
MRLEKMLEDRLEPARISFRSMDNEYQPGDKGISPF